MRFAVVRIDQGLSIRGDGMTPVSGAAPNGGVALTRNFGQVKGRLARRQTGWRTGLVLAAVVTSGGMLAAAGTGAVAAASPAAGTAAVGSAPVLPAGARLLGPAPRSATLQVTLALRSRDPAGLAKLAREVSMPSASGYRRFLDPRQDQARFGPRPAVLSALRSWLRGRGLTVRPTSGDGLLVPVTGSVAEMEQAFRTPIRLVRLANGRIAHANSRPARIPVAIRSRVVAVLGLDNLVLPEPYTATPSPAGPGAQRPVAGRPASAGPQACLAAMSAPAAFTAGELAHAYSFEGLYRRGVLGQGMTVALFELGDYADSDISTYTRCYGIGPIVRRVRIDGGTTISASPDSALEATADIETVTGMAPRARILVYEAPMSIPAYIDNYGAILQQDRAQVVSASYGFCEPFLSKFEPGLMRVEAGIFENMAIQGQSMLTASGDAGSAACLRFLAGLHARGYQPAVGDPAGQPFVTAVGGTAITRYGSPPGETTWNESGPTRVGSGFPAPFNGRDGRPDGYPGNLVGGGGISSVWRMPSWQRNFDTSGNSSGTPCGAPRGTDCREVPDVSALAAAGLSATPGYAIYFTAAALGGRGWISGGGTSLASPLWAALAVLADQRTPSHRLGLLSPALYGIDRSDSAAFNDVAVGNDNYLAPSGSPANNTCSYQGVRDQPCYEATRGYDMATGLGSPQASLLAADLAVPAADAGAGRVGRVAHHR
jgi:subtilase family serine protease